jgi:hypothetical protein
MKKSTVLKLIQDELELAQTQHTEPMHSPHEGYAVIKEELDELWDEVKANKGTSHRGVSEAVQTAAMAMRYLEDLCPEETAVSHELEKRGEVQKFWLGTFTISPSGATETCRFCGTQYDTHHNVGEVPPVGDGCAMCAPEVTE